MDNSKEITALRKIIADPNTDTVSRAKATERLRTIEDSYRIVETEETSPFEKKMMGIERKFTNGEISEEEAQALLEEMMEEMGSAMEEILTSLMGVVTEGMTDILGSMFSSIGSELTPTEEEVLSIAKKYYDIHKKLIPLETATKFSHDVGAVKFNGTLYDETRADDLSNKAAELGGNCSQGVAAAAAAVGWAPSYTGGANALACALEEALFIKDEDRLKDAEKMSRYAIFHYPEDPGLYITLARILHKNGDKDGALNALDEALEYQPDHNAALKLKQKIQKEN